MGRKINPQNLLYTDLSQPGCQGPNCFQHRVLPVSPDSGTSREITEKRIEEDQEMQLILNEAFSKHVKLNSSPIVDHTNKFYFYCKCA